MTSDERTRPAEIDLMLREYSMLRDEMKVFLDYHRRDIQIFAGIIGALVGVYLTNSRVVDVRVVAAIIPSSIFLFYLLQIINLHMVSTEAKACGRIEARINGLVGVNAMDWEHVVAKTVVRGTGSPIGLVTTALLLFFWIIFVVFAWKATQAYGVIATLAHGAEFLVMIGASVWWAVFERKGCLPTDSETTLHRDKLRER